MMEDEIYLELCVEVNDNNIIVNLPEIPQIQFEDDDLDYLFCYPDAVQNVTNEEQAEFWNSVIPELIRIRERKRDLYSDMNFQIA
jgi:hypothetical protein